MPSSVPRATYRLQLSGKFGFGAAAALIPYLQALGISHLYASPFLKARAGSTHGYDIVDHSTFNPEFGGAEGFRALSDALKAADMGLILDFVPNHMGVGYADNRWWLDVLEWGPKSPHAESFDIDWYGLPNRREAGLLLPILGKPYNEALEQGDIVLKFEREEGSFSAWYFEHRLPIRPNRYAEILRTVVAAAGAENQAAGARMLQLAAQYHAPTAPSREDAPALKAALIAMAADGGADIIARGLHAYRTGPDNPAHAPALHRLLERQHYRLAHWRVAVSEINYRRFFDVSDLAGIRVETWKTFRAVHHLVAALIADGHLNGLRIDHIDGLNDPIEYSRRLQRLARRHRPPGRAPFYIVAEKILADDEDMPPLPGIAGTTGYDVLNDLSRVLLDDAGRPVLDHTWRRVAGANSDFQQVVRAAKLHVIESIMASEFSVLARLLARIAAGHYPSRDYTFDRLHAALELFVVNFPVYRTYITGTAVSAHDRKIITGTIENARSQWHGPDAVIFDFIKDALTLELVAPGRVGYGRDRVRRFAFKMQQFTGPVMAKALEDTSFYRYHRLLALNEVGGDPSLPGLSPNAFHRRMVKRAAETPAAMTGTATHDTKRGEDARMRILALSELADDWSEAVHRWRQLNDRLRHARTPAPTPAHEYMIYQTLIGAWPSDGPDDDFIRRIEGYAIKAAREGKQQTSWINPNENYENSLTEFVRLILDPGKSRDFINGISTFAARTALIGALNSLSQLVLKATIPGVPDFFQGTEFWDLALVDPDNRRPVDFSSRRHEMATDVDWPSLTTHWRDGRIKLALTRRLLALRNAHANLFAAGDHVPIPVTGADRDHVIAFARVADREAVVVAVGRHFASATEGGRQWPNNLKWDAALDLAGFHAFSDALAPVPRGNVAAISDLFATLPVTVLRATRC